MKIQEIIKRFDKESAQENYINVDGFIQNALSEHFYWNLYDPKNEIEKRFKSYYLFTWYCTDSWVGYRLYFLNDEFICYSLQVGRKYDEQFFFLSKETYDKIYNFLASFRERHSFDQSIIGTEYEDIEEYMTINFSGQLIPNQHPKAFIPEKNIEFDIDYDWVWAQNKRDDINHLIKDKNSENIYDIRDCKFRIRIKDLK